MLFQVINESIFSSITFVINWVVFSVLGEKFNGGESFDFNSFNFVSSGVHLGNDQSLNVFEFLSKGIVDGDKLLAVTAPGSVEFNQNIIVGVDNNILEVLTDENLNRFVVFFRGWVQT